MATIVKEEIPTEVRREISGTPRRRVPWWLLAVIVALVVGLVAGAAGWQATRTDATAATKSLAERYIAANTYMHPARAPEFFAPNAVWIDATIADIFRGRAGVAHAYAISQLPNMKIKETLVYAGPDMFVVDQRMTASSGPACAKPVNASAVLVNQVKDGLITRQTIWWDTSSVVFCKGTTYPTMPK